MCILFIAIKQHLEYPLIICANRDEFHQRPTQAAHFWKQPKEMLAGKDLQAGGSWLGINKTGQFAAITNIRNGQPTSQDKRSRGELVTKVLDDQETRSAVIDYEWLKQHSDDYNGFNLIYGNLNGLYCYNSVSKLQIRLDNGFHAISNGGMDDVWPKMAKGEKKLEAIVTSLDGVDEEALLAILKDQSQANDTELPLTGIPAEWEQLLSSIFIVSEQYGTRSSSLLLQRSDTSIKFTEVGYDKRGEQVSLNCFELTS
ncbi:MAG: hypothetical protein COA74_12935 [Gammaproteobacteria bacterium]|nr:MAG: hypothetical protein COA74_12935 [Gammaproteobacteria bacterium]